MFYEPCFRKMADYTATGFTSPMFPSSPFIGTTFPTGAPLGPHYAPLPAPTMPGNIPAPPQPAPPAQFPTPQTIQSTYYTAGFLKTQIGKRMRVEFLIGTNGALVDRTGTLVGVGTSYILLQPDGTNITILADLYSIKFVTIYPGGEAIVWAPYDASYWLLGNGNELHFMVDFKPEVAGNGSISGTGYR